MDIEKHFEEEREKMVQTQLIPRGITDKSVLEVMRGVPRHRFVLEDLVESAYCDYPLPIGEGQTISQPYMVALMTQYLELSGDEKILEIGTGSGYQAAILAELAGQIYTVERIEKLSRRAGEVSKALGYTNIQLKVGDGSEGWAEFSPYDGIIVTAGSPDTPGPLSEQLSEGGRLVIPVGGYYSQELVVMEKKNGKLEKRKVCGCIFVPLVGRHGWEK
jgi:protein-L-isoaspartate(D-aspartate) O-methyltransferase